MTSEFIDPRMAAAQRAVRQLIEDGAPDRVIEAGRSVCRCLAQRLPFREVDMFTLRQHAERRQRQDRYGQ